MSLQWVTVGCKEGPLHWEPRAVKGSPSKAWHSSDLNSMVVETEPATFQSQLQCSAIKLYPHCWLSDSYHIEPPCYCSHPSHCQSAAGKLHVNVHTPLTQQSPSGLTMLSRHSVGTHQDNELTCSAHWITVDWPLTHKNRIGASKLNSISQKVTTTKSASKEWFIRTVPPPPPPTPAFEGKDTRSEYAHAWFAHSPFNFICSKSSLHFSLCQCG